MRRAVPVLRGVCAVVGALSLLVTLTPVTVWWARWFSGPFADPGGEVLVVLAASNLEDGVAGPASYWRAMYAVRAFRSSRFEWMVISGGPEGASSAALAMRRLILAQEIPGAAVHVDSVSNSTRESALTLTAALKPLNKRAVLLTSDYHMLRARRAFQKAGLEVIPRPLPDAVKRASSWPARWTVFLDLSVESAKIAYYAVRRWI